MRPAALLAVLAPIIFSIALPESSASADGLTKTWAIAEFGEPLYKDNFTHWPYVNPDAPKGGSIVLDTFGSFDSLNPYILKGEWPRSIGLTSDSLMTGSDDELSTAYGLIAETAEYPADKSWIAFTLRTEARYHDGVAITAQDFVFAFDMIRQHGRPFLKSFYKDVETAEALSDRKVKFTFATRDNMKPLLVVARMNPLPRHYWKDREFNATTLEPPLGSGPYRIAKVEPGRRLTYERVENYWARELPVNVGRNNFDRISYEYYRDPTVAFEAFKAGSIDFRQENRAQRWATGYDFKAVKDGRVIKREVPSETPRGMQGYFFNLRRAQLADVRVREAISELYDFEATQRLLLYGQYTRTKSYFPTSDFAADGPPSEEEKAILAPYADQLPARVLTEAFEPSKTDGSGRNRRNLRKALGLFKDAGWTVQNGKLINSESGEQLALEILMVSPALERLTAPFLQNLRHAGIDATMRLVDSAQYEKRLDDFDFDIMTVVLNFFPPPGPELRSYFGSDAAGVPGSANMAGIQNPVADALIEQIVNARDLDRLKALTRALDRVLLWEHAAIPQFHNDTARLAYWDLFAYPERKPRYDDGFLDTWWIDEAKYAKLRARRDAQ